MDYMNEIDRAKALIEEAIKDAQALAEKLPDGLAKVEALTLVSKLVQTSVVLMIRRPVVPCRLDFIATSSTPVAVSHGLALSESAVCALADEHCNGRMEGGAYLFKPFSLTLFAEAIQTATSDTSIR